jgi:uncharacterized protein
MSITRRHFIRNAGAIALGFSGLGKLYALGRYEGIFSGKSTFDYGYGELIPDPNGIFDLPAGFSYKIISKTGDRMSDGFYVPGLPDGMAAFPGSQGRTILIRNHELHSKSPNSSGPFGINNELLLNISKDKFYDEGTHNSPALGGTSTIIYNVKTGEVEREFLSLAGTLRNCAGGPTPWNSWITCEETVLKKGDGFLQDHGYVFDVPATVDIKLADPVPLKDLGRFNHEAVAVDPLNGIVYQTEDVNDGLIYRFIPNSPGDLKKGGQLEALAVKRRPSLDTRNWDRQTVNVGQKFEVEWVPIEDVESPNDDLRHQGFSKGAAKFARGEGMWYGNNEIYFACTTGGKARKGQIWKLSLNKNDNITLELFVEPNDGNIIEHADNLTVSPWGDLIVCEDGPGDNFLVGITPNGEIYKFGRNALNESELAGSVFSPDGSTLFFNLQSSGYTLAVTGPWKYKR